MKIKRLFVQMVCVLVCLMMPLPALANFLSFFGDYGACAWNDYRIQRGNPGTLTPEDIGFKAGEGEKVTDFSKSAFPKFNFYRGQNFYTNTSDETTFSYAKTNSQVGPRLFNEAYFFGVQNPENNKKNYQVDFMASFSSELRKLVAKGDIEMRIVVNAQSFKSTFNNQTAIAAIRTYNNTSPIQQEFKTPEEKYDGARQVTTSNNWNKINSDITRVIVDLKSERGGLSKQNQSAIYNVRVYLRDVKGPAVAAAGIHNTASWTGRKNIAGQTVYGKGVGDTVTYYVTFDEKISVSNTGSMKLALKGAGNTTYYADFSSFNGSDTIYFTYRIPNNASLANPDKTLNVYGQALSVEGGKITDVAGNNLSGKNVGNKFNNSTYTIDDTATGLSPDSWQDMSFYPQKYPIGTSTVCNAYGKIPDSLIAQAATGASGSPNNQPTMFAIGSEGPVFRVVLDDEVQKSCLNSTTKLKLEILDSKYNRAGYAYAPLIAARINRINKATPANGVKSDGTTELLFQYTPAAQGDLPLYFVEIAGTALSGGGFRFDSDSITYNQNAKLVNISGMTVDGENMLVPSTFTYRTPTNRRVLVDTAPPSLTSRIISDGYVQQLPAGSKLVFHDASAFSTGGAAIAVYSLDSANKKKYIDISFPGSAVGKKLLLPVISSIAASGGYNATVNLAGLRPAQEVASEKLYLEYSVSDAAGNVCGSVHGGENEIKFDNTAPKVSGSSYEVDRNSATVSYDVSDIGIGEISPQIFYRVEEIGKAYDTIGHLIASNNSQTVSITGNQGERNTWRVHANFADTVGNRMKAFYPSSNIDIATRVFGLQFKDSYPVVSDRHSVKFDLVKMPETDYSLDVFYQWSRGSAVNDNYKKAVFTDNAALSSFDFADEKIQKAYNNGELFEGEFTLYAYAVMHPDNAQQNNITLTCYFDKSAPEIYLSVKNSEGTQSASRKYHAEYSFSDDGARYRGGIFTKNNNIALDENNLPFYELLIGGEVAESGTVDSYIGGLTLDIYNKYKDDERFSEATKARLRFTAKDTFGHSATAESDEFNIDLKAPEISPFAVSGNVLPRGENTYIINSFSDIDSISATITDNVADGVNIWHRQGGAYKISSLGEVSTEHVFTYENPIHSDFSTDFKDGVDYRVYTLEATDKGGNAAAQNVRFILDRFAPSIYSVNTSEISAMTNAPGKEITLYYEVDPYEAADDISISLSGAEVVSHELGEIVLLVSENETVRISLTDLLGKSDSRSIEVNCFDREPPTISIDTMVQTPDAGAAKYGEITIKVSDNDAPGNLVVALTTDAPGEGDYFSDIAGSRLIEDGLDENGAAIWTQIPGGYFADEKGIAHALLQQVDKNTYCLSYHALPEAAYQLYGKISDAAGNITEEKLADLLTSGEPAQVTESGYTPSWLTGGGVTLGIKTDIPTMIEHPGDADGNIAAMQENIKKMRQRGYTYVYNGEQKTISTFEEAARIYAQIATKYDEEPENLTDEEKQLFRNRPEVDYWSPYFDFLSTEYDGFTQPVGDLLDYLCNGAYYGHYYEGWTPVFTAEEPPSSRIILPDEPDWYDNVELPLMLAGLAGEGWVITSLASVSSAAPEFNLGGPGESDYSVPLYNVDVFNYPAKFDLLSGGEFIASNYIETEALGYINPFYGFYAISAQQISDFLQGRTVAGFDELEELDYDRGNYYSPFNYMEYILTLSDIEEVEGLSHHLDLFETAALYENPYTESGPPMSGAQIEATQRAITRFQKARELTARTVAEKYVKSYMSMDNQGFALSHILRYPFNISETLSLLDKTGQSIAFPVEIDWIDKSLPHVPDEYIKLMANGRVVTDVINAASATVDIEVPSFGVYNEYYLTNVPENAVGEAVANEEYSETTLYKKIEIPVYENETVYFDIVNPLAFGVDDARALARQGYTVSQFDRIAPTAQLAYSPSAGGGAVNTDVTVSLINIDDNRDTAASIAVNETQHTFAENGSFTFTLTDSAGNTRHIVAAVDYIDKSPVAFEVEFVNDGGDISQSFEKTESAEDYKGTSTSYVYNGERLRSDVQAIVRVGGSIYKVFQLNENNPEIHEIYTTKSGNTGALDVTGIIFDTEAPTAKISYNHIREFGKKSYAEAIVTLADNYTETPIFSGISGRDETGKIFTAQDVAILGNTLTVRFSDNGFATLLFADEAGNQSAALLSVSSLDRTPPRAFVQYSTTAPTNQDVTATITLTKAADYQIYGDGNSLIRDYQGTYTTYLNYAFFENKTLVFKFRDTDGNETEGLMASVNNIDKAAPALALAQILKNEALDIDGNLVPYMGAATIVLKAESAGDVFEGDSGDTILLSNVSQSKYHTVMDNGRYKFAYSDVAGNIGVLYVDVDVIDKTPPTATVWGNPTEWVTTQPTITATANAKADGAPSYIVENGVNHSSVAFTPAENGVYTYLLRDESGNSSTLKIDVNYVDTISPTITYKNGKDRYIVRGEFNREDIEDVIAADNENGSGLDGGVQIDYGAFDKDTPGKYDITFTAKDIAGNVTTLVRTINVLFDTDVFAAINGQILIPNEQATFWQGSDLKLSFLNADKTGERVSYAFEPGYFMAAQMKGSRFKALAGPAQVIDLQAEKPGMYTLFLQTEDRQIMTMYVFIAGAEQ